ncbi:MAG: hypothetical protein IAE80_07360 [Anaerolinea sp.]|nr:hypothetical protein [Anaerolinea sp.]
MTHQAKKQRRHLIGFLMLVALVVTGGAILWTQGDLTSPLQSTTLLLNLSSSDAGFSMVGEEGTRPEPPDTTVSEVTVAAPAAAGSITLDEFTAALAAEGVDVEAISAQMSAGGRGLENLLAVVNSGRTTVAELAARFKGDIVTDTGDSGESVSAEMSDGGSTGLLDIRWDEFGSVAYDLWFLLAVTAAVIVFARPVGWLVKRVKRTPA